MRKTFLLLLSAWLLPAALRACEVCSRNQPRALRNITHGTGPQGNADYLIIGSAAVIVLLTLFLSLKFLLRPGENEPTHVKHSVIEKM